MWSHSYKYKPPADLDGIATADVSEPADPLRARFERAKENRLRYLDGAARPAMSTATDLDDVVSAVDGMFASWEAGGKASKLHRAERKARDCPYKGRGCAICHHYDQRSRSCTYDDGKNNDWDDIERLNRDVGIDRDNSYIDGNGYLRWKVNDRLCHRDVAYKNVQNGTGIPFRECDVHHVDGNKWNDDPSNLEILSRDAHDDRHDRVARHRETRQCGKPECSPRSCTGCPFYNEYDRTCQK